MPCHRWRLRGFLGDAERRYLLAVGRTLVGSDPRCDLVLDNHGVSRRHATIEIELGDVTLEDRKSKNGTFVNGGRITASRVFLGDRLGFGPVELELETVRDDDVELAISAPITAPAAGAATGAESDPGTTRAVESPSPEPRQACGELLLLPPGFLRGSSPAMSAIHRDLRQIADSDVPVLLTGETGVGKEHLVQSLHRASARRDGPLVAVNCAAIPRELLEAELFGIGRGVATGVEARPGTFRRADGGTLFLDEIGDLPLSLQAKLLRALQEREIHPLGRPPVAVDVRVISATNADLTHSMEEQAFRSDLYFRLAGFVCRVPPLRERPEDLPGLVAHFLRRFTEDAGKTVRGVTVRALRRLESYRWPGNVRELEHEIRRLVALCPAAEAIESSLLSAPIRGESPATPDPRRSPAPAPRPDSADPEALVRKLGDLRLETLERACIREALERSRGNKAEAARRLGISRSALGRRLARYGD